MVRDLSAFVGERFPLYVSVPMAVSVTAVGAERASWLTLVLTAGSVWWFLLGARLLDDLVDLELDKLRRPRRGLVTGHISASRLKPAVAYAWLFSGLPLVPLGWSSLALLAACAAWTRGYYAIRSSLPGVVKPFFLNAPFAALALLAPLATGRVHGAEWLLAAFLWLGVVGHDFVHSIEDGVATSNALRPRNQATLGTTCYLAALGAALAFVALSGDAYFALALVAVSCPMAWLLASLARLPCEQRSQRTYVPGGLVFILPLLSRLAQQLLR